jgi:hypothetical protein
MLITDLPNISGIPDIEQDEWEVLGLFLRIKFRYDDVIQQIYDIYLKRVQVCVDEHAWQDAYRKLYHCPDPGVKYCLHMYIYKEQKEYESKNGLRN